MRKRYIFLSIFVLAVMLAVIFFMTRPSLKDLEASFPADSVVYARMRYVAENLEGVGAASFYKSISSINIVKVLEHHGFSKQDIIQFDKMQKEWELILKSPLAKKLGGQEVAVALYDNGDIVVATRIGFSMQMAERVISLGREWADDITTESKPYEGFNIVHVRSDKRKMDLQYVRIHDVVFAAAYPSDILRRFIDVYQGRKPSISSQKSFNDAKMHFYPEGHALMHIDIKRLLGMLKDHLPKSVQEPFSRFTKESLAFRSYSLSFMPGQTSSLKFILDLDGQKLPSALKGLSGCAAPVNGSLAVTPHNAVVYNWSGCYRFNELLALFEDQGGDAQASEGLVDQWKRRIERRFKLSVQKDILPVLGVEAGGYLNEIDVKGVFPYPRGVLFVKTTNRASAERLMQKFAMTPLGPLEKEEYRRIDMHYLPIGIGFNMDPGYAFLGDYLLVGSSRQLLRASIDAFNNKDQSLLSSKDLEDLDIRQKSPAHAVLFIRVKEVAGRLIQLADWYNKIVSSQITAALSYQREIKERKAELRDLLEPKNEELSVAQKRLKTLHDKLSSGAIMAEDERKTLLDTIEHLSSDIDIIKDELESFKQQETELDEAMAAFHEQAISGKSWLFNSDEIFKPVLKGLSGFNVLGVKWRSKGSISEMEILIK